jgi:hypothetical protein
MMLHRDGQLLLLERGESAVWHTKSVLVQQQLCFQDKKNRAKALSRTAAMCVRGFDAHEALQAWVADEKARAANLATKLAARGMALTPEGVRDQLYEDENAYGGAPDEVATQ